MISVWLQNWFPPHTVLPETNASGALSIAQSHLFKGVSLEAALRQAPAASHKTGELKGAQLEQIHPEAQKITLEGGELPARSHYSQAALSSDKNTQSAWIWFLRTSLVISDFLC